MTYWDKIRPELQKDFNERGINYCEIGFPSCKPYLGLFFAHSKKRIDIIEPKFPLHELSTQQEIDNWQKFEEDMREVIRACNACHSVIEYWKTSKRNGLIPEEYADMDMTSFVKMRIKNRLW